MPLESRIYVAGHRGLAGSAIVRELQRQGYTNLVTRTHAELDLEDAAATQRFFEQEQPEIVFLAAAKVGGILANNTYPVDFLMSNLLIEANICRAAHRAQVKRLIFLGSSCIYPRDCPQPIREEYLLTGPLEATNRPYALAKIAGIEMCWSYNRQYGTKWLAAMPTNLYGPGDNYDLNNSHVLPALIRKMHEAKMSGANEVVLWGSGKPKREFLYVDDLANALVYPRHAGRQTLQHAGRAVAMSADQCRHRHRPDHTRAGGNGRRCGRLQGQIRAGHLQAGWHDAQGDGCKQDPRPGMEGKHQPERRNHVQDLQEYCKQPT